MTLEDMKRTIETAIPQSAAYILDPMNDGQHLQAFVVSPIFEGLPLFKQQQMVMKALKNAFDSVHALGLKTFTPTEWQTARLKYGL